MKKLLFLLVMALSSCHETTPDEKLSQMKSPVVIIAVSSRGAVCRDAGGEVITISAYWQTGGILNQLHKGDTIK